jgi:hypothetical protein
MTTLILTSFSSYTSFFHLGTANATTAIHSSRLLSRFLGSLSAGLDGASLVNDILILHDFAGKFGEMALDLVVRRNFAAAGIRGASIRGASSRGAGVLVGVGAGVTVVVVMMTGSARGGRGTVAGVPSVTRAVEAGVACPGVAKGLRAQGSARCRGEGIIVLAEGASIGSPGSRIVRIGAGLASPSSEVTTLHSAGSGVAVVSVLLTNPRSIVTALRSAESSVANRST